MDKISGLLKKYIKLVKSENNTKNIISGVFKELFNFELGAGDIKIEESMIVIKCSPSLKSEIFLNKRNILEKINKETGLVFKKII